MFGAWRVHSDGENNATRVSELVDELQETVQERQRAWEELEMMLDCRERIRSEMDELVEWYSLGFFIVFCLSVGQKQACLLSCS